MCVHRSDPITFEEMNEILKTFKNRKAPGGDEIDMEIFKYASITAKLRFLNILNICWAMYQIPDDRRKAIIISIFKKGSRRDCNNYRGISMLNSAYKIYAKNIVTRCLNTITEVLLQEEQHGFRRGRSCADCTFTIRQSIQKRREFNLEMHILSVDYVKAF
jgi:sorting nexin-29